jgi:hypothetical protein
MGRHGLPNFLVLREGFASMRRDPLAPPAQTSSSISRCRTREIIQLDESDYDRGSRASRYVRDAALLQERSKCRTTVGWAMKTGSTSSLIARMTTRPSPAWRLAPTASGHDRHRCRRAQSQQAVPGQHLGRGASVDRPGWPAITRL